MTASNHNNQSPLDSFHPIVRRWFGQTFGEPSPPQREGWPSIMRGENTLLLAPTGSGKTLAAFLWAINHLFERHVNNDPIRGIGILYISPLKALNNDIHRNLQAPLEGIFALARQEGLEVPKIRTAVRTGDTPQSERARMVRNPPEILITTPESLYLMLTARRSRPLFTDVQYVIVDEIHSVCGNKRGVHLSLTLERLAEIAEQEFVRIGLSATQRPLDLIARYLGGNRLTGERPEPRHVTIVDAGRKKEMDLRVTSPVADFSALPQESVWPVLFQQLLDLILTHRNTLVFVNNRRLAERIAAQLNNMLTETNTPHGLYHVPRGGARTQGEHPAADFPRIMAYHGSMSREVRESMEGELKAGNLRALIATSSLELGIDIGSIDLVVQVQSPKGIARGLQRVGRSGHLITATSKGRIFPSHREDLVESAVVARAMVSHDVEETSIPQNCLDVLAQQIVAMVSVEEQDIDRLFDLVRGSFCYESLKRSAFISVVEMLSGRYDRGALRELRARISWDKWNNLLRALPGSAHLAISGGGTIPDRGYYGVYLEDGKTKVGEVDEEFVFESRNGDTFILGTDTWRITTIDSGRLTVVPAPGEPARMPFWRGEGMGRSFELGQLVGRFRRQMDERQNAASTLQWLQTEFPVDHDAAWNIQEYFRKQHQVAGMVPHDRLIVVEGFRDEIGDPRVVVHSCFGRRVNGLLGLFLLGRVQETAGFTAQMLYNDDGVLLRFPDTEQIPLDFLNGVSAEGAVDRVVEEMLDSPLFGGQFRQNASRALLMPRPAGGKRSPLWLQRLRAKDLLEVAREFADFPIVIETIREVLNDILDLKHFKEVMTRIEQGEIRVQSVQTEVPSPFASSLLFDFIAVYVYEWDQPRADRAGKFLAVNRELLGELIDLNESPMPLRPEAIDSIESQLQHTADGYKARSPEELHEILLRLGDLTKEEVSERCDGNPADFLTVLSGDGRAVLLDIGKTPRWVAGEYADLFRLESTTAVSNLLLRMLQNHGIVTTDQISDRYSLPAGVVTEALEHLESAKEAVRVTDAPGATGNKAWAVLPNLQRMRRRTITVLRREIRPVPLSRLTQFLVRWQHIDPSTLLQGEDGVQHCIQQMQGLDLPVEVWERDILRSRILQYNRDMVSRFSSSGRIIWCGSGVGRLMVVPRGEGGVFLNHEETDAGLREPAMRILTFLGKNGASFFADIRTGTGLSLGALNRGMAELFWHGNVTNDLFEEILNIKKYRKEETGEPADKIELVYPRRNERRSHVLRSMRTALKQTPGWNGRWSLIRTESVLGNPLSIEERAREQARVLLDRYGVVARELAKRESMLPWPLLAAELQTLELRGEIRRGYFVEGLSGMQFALPIAAEQLREQPEKTAARILLNACDPAIPFGQGIALPPESGLPVPTRNPQNFLLVTNGSPAFLIENYGMRMWLATGGSDEDFREGVQQLLNRGLSEVHVHYINNERPGGTRWEPILRPMGFYRDKDQTMRRTEPG